MEALKGIKKVHFIGIGGIGMSALAQLLIKSGYEVTGSDIRYTVLIKKIEDMGAKVFINHSPTNIKDVSLVVYSSSIPQNNIELIQARNQGICIKSRGKLLSELMNNKRGITVCGTHGKTTTSSLIATLLYKAGLNPTISVGAEVPVLGGNALLGSGDYFVAEADESDGSFLYLSPEYSVITNIEREHLDYYQDIDEIIQAYKKFASSTKEEGCLFACADDDNLKKVLSDYPKEFITYGLEDSADVQARNIKIQELSSTFDCYYRGDYFERFLLNIPGIYNVVNSLAAISLSIRLNIKKTIVKEALFSYTGAKRRFQVKAKIGGITVIEDYAHHPTEIKATIQAASYLKPERIIVVFQPHRYTRTKYFKDSFGVSLEKADYLILTNIYSAHEEAIEGVSSKLIYDFIVKRGHKSTYLLPKEEISKHLLKVIKPKDAVLVLGAGDIGEVSDELVKGLKEQNSF